jgi:hypothetical protein
MSSLPRAALQILHTILWLSELGGTAACPSAPTVGSFKVPCRNVVVAPPRSMQMRPEANTQSCDNPSYFSDVLTPAVEERLPTKGSFTARIIDHTTGIRPFVETVSQDLCDDGRMSTESGKKAIGFITRSATSAVVIGGTATLVGLGLVIGSPVLAVGAGIAALAVLPPLVERATFGVASFASDLLEGVRRRRTGDFD